MKPTTDSDSGPGDLLFREARDDDAAAVVALVAAAYAECPGCVLDVDGEQPELRAPASAHAEMGGQFWVAEQGGRVVGCIGCRPTGQGDVELLRLYVAPEARDRGLGRRLVGIVCTLARRRGAGHVELWTDTRFEAAHHLYERLGFERSPGTRTLDDLSHSVEVHYRRAL